MRKPDQSLKQYGSAVRTQNFPIFILAVCLVLHPVSCCNKFSQWCSEARHRPGPNIKVPLFPLLKCAYKNLKWRSFFMLSKDIKNIETFWTPGSNTHKLKWVSFFILDYGSCFSCLFSTFLIICSSYFFLPSLHVDIWTGHILLNFLPCWLSVWGKSHHLDAIVCSFWWIKQKTQNMCYCGA